MFLKSPARQRAGLLFYSSTAVKTSRPGRTRTLTLVPMAKPAAFNCRAPNSHRSFDQISGRRKLKIYDCFTTFSS